MKKRPEWLQLVVDKTNSRIRLASTDVEKAAMCLVLDDVLFHHGSYKGFHHRYWCEQGYDEWVAAGKPEEKERYIFGPDAYRYDWIYI
jgi:hypothetical protein